MSTAVLLHFEGTPGDQTFVDEVGGLVFTADDTDQVLATSAAVFGTTGLSLPTVNRGITATWPLYLDLSSKFTIEFIWKTGSAPNTGSCRFICANNDVSGPYGDQLMFLTCNSGVLEMYGGVYGSSDVHLTFPDLTFAANTTYRIALTRDSSNVLRAFKDGVVSTTTYTTTLNWNHVGKLLQIGCSHNSASPFSGDQFSGTAAVGGLDELRISDECLYTANYTVATAPFTLGAADAYPTNDGKLVLRHPSVGSLSTDGRTYTSSGTAQDEACYGPVGRRAPSGKFYCEFTVIQTFTSSPGFYIGVGEVVEPGVTSSNVPNPTTPTDGRHVWCSLGAYNDYYNGDSKDGPGFNGHNFDGTDLQGGFNVDGNVVGVLMDSATAHVKFYLNGTYVATAPSLVLGLKCFAPMLQLNSNDTIEVRYNGGEEDFVQTPGSETDYLGWDYDTSPAIPGDGDIVLDQFVVEVLKKLPSSASLNQFAVEALVRRQSGAKFSFMALEVMEKITKLRLDQFVVELLRPAPSVQSIATSRVMSFFGVEAMTYECPRDAGGGGAVDDNGTKTSGNNLGTGSRINPLSGSPASGEDLPGQPMTLQAALTSMQIGFSENAEFAGLHDHNYRRQASYITGNGDSTCLNDNDTGVSVCGNWTWDGIDRNNITWDAYTTNFSGGPYAGSHTWTDPYALAAAYIITLNAVAGGPWHDISVLHDNGVDVYGVHQYSFDVAGRSSFDDHIGPMYGHLVASEGGGGTGTCGPAAQMPMMNIEVMTPTTGGTSAQLSMLNIELMMPTSSDDLLGGFS